MRNIMTFLLFSIVLCSTQFLRQYWLHQVRRYNLSPSWGTLLMFDGAKVRKKVISEKRKAKNLLPHSLFPHPKGDFCGTLNYLNPSPTRGGT